MRVRWSFLLAWVLVAATSVAGCVEEGDVALKSLSFDGVTKVRESELRAALASRPGSRLPFSRREPFDQARFEQDLKRIATFYADRGYPDARVDGIDVAFNSKRDAVTVRVRMFEGDPLLVDSIAFEGFESLDEASRPRTDGLQVAVGLPRDRAAVLAVRQAATDTFRDNGFAYGAVEVHERATTPGRVALVFQATPGPKTIFGPVTIAGLADVEERVVRRQLSVRAGDPYRASRVTQSQRRLASLEILQFTNIDARPPATGQPVEIPVRVTVAEDKPRRLKLGLGYGTEDRARGSVEWSHLNFFGNARRASVVGRWSSIERGGQVSLSEPFFLRRGLSFESSASSWWTREEIYRSETQGGRAGITWRLGGRTRGSARAASDIVKLAYLYEFLKYEVRPESLAELGNVEQLIALGLDPVTGKGSGTRTAIAADFERSAVNNLINPRSGYAATAHLEVASPALGGSFRYTEARGELRGYVPLGGSVLAARARAGSIIADSDADVPFSQRYFLGGASSLRGWGRYQVAPLSDGIPVGGRTMTDLSVELRVPVRGPIGLVGFVDAGNVWAQSLDASTKGFRGDVGVGLRYATPIGLIRGDAAVQLTPLDGLLVDGVPESRTWRLHVSIGHAF